MKAFFIPVFAGLILLACSKKETNSYDATSLFGSWKEYEAYADPGDGSGTFHKVDGILLTINPDSSYTCTPEHYVWGKSGRITLINDSTISINSSQGATGWPASFRKYNNMLELGYICIEGCGSRFKKISNDYRLDN